MWQQVVQLPKSLFLVSGVWPLSLLNFSIPVDTEDQFINEPSSEHDMADHFLILSFCTLFVQNVGIFDGDLHPTEKQFPAPRHCFPQDAVCNYIVVSNIHTHSLLYVVNHYGWLRDMFISSISLFFLFTGWQPASLLVLSVWVMHLSCHASNNL